MQSVTFVSLVEVDGGEDELVIFRVFYCLLAQFDIVIHLEMLLFNPWLLIICLSELVIFPVV